METKKLTNAEVNAYGAFGTLLTFSIWVPTCYLSIFMTTYLGISASVMGTIYLVSMTADIVFSLLAGGLVDSLTFKKGKYLPWINALRWVVMFGSVGQVVNTSAMPLAFRLVVISVCYMAMHGSMNFVATAQSGIVAAVAGSNMEDRIKLTTRSTQISAGASIFLNFGTLPLITFIGKLSGDASLGYTIVGIAYAMFLLIGTVILNKYLGKYDDPALVGSPGKKFNLADMWRAIAGNDQMVVYALSQFVMQTGMNIVGGMGMYYWMLIMDRYQLSSVSSGLSTCAGFIFSLFIPSIGRKLGKVKSQYVATTVSALSNIAILMLALKSTWYMTAISIVSMATGYLTYGFGINYYLDIGEYGYYKTGKDYRTLCISMSNILMKFGRVGGTSLSGYVLAWIGFDKFNQMMLSGTLNRATEEFAAFSKTFMGVYCLIPLCAQVIGLMIFIFGYKIKDEDAVFYAAENAKKA
ncbi:MAG: DUF2837 family protein [Eubacteriaceae bacterium]|nr:DUF2837 family protein [Eubacteriaceae bacterium]